MRSCARDKSQDYLTRASPKPQGPLTRCLYLGSPKPGEPFGRTGAGFTTYNSNAFTSDGKGENQRDGDSHRQLQS